MYSYYEYMVSFLYIYVCYDEYTRVVKHSYTMMSIDIVQHSYMIGEYLVSFKFTEYFLLAVIPCMLHALTHTHTHTGLPEQFKHWSFRRCFRLTASPQAPGTCRSEAAKKSQGAFMYVCISVYVCKYVCMYIHWPARAVEESQYAIYIYTYMCACSKFWWCNGRHGARHGMTWHTCMHTYIHTYIHSYDATADTELDMTW
jgi:hypothetical protein